MHTTHTVSNDAHTCIQHTPFRMITVLVQQEEKKENRNEGRTHGKTRVCHELDAIRQSYTHIHTYTCAHTCEKRVIEHEKKRKKK
jgi:hypothetical protein